MQLGFQNQGPINQPMNPAQQIGGQLAVANAMFRGDDAPQRHMEAYQQAPEPLNLYIGKMQMPILLIR